MRLTSLEQSYRLVGLGLDPNSATNSWFEVVTPENETYYCSGEDAPRGVLSRYDCPAWSLDELLEVMPPEIEYKGMTFCLALHKWLDPETEETRYEVGYLFDGMNPPEGCYDNLDPITSAYELCVWCLESGYVKRKGMLYES